MPSAGHKVDSVTVLSPANATKVHESLVWSLTPLQKLKCLLCCISGLRFEFLERSSNHPQMPAYHFIQVVLSSLRFLKGSSNHPQMPGYCFLQGIWHALGVPRTILKPSSTARILFFTSDSHQFEVLRLGTYIILKDEVSSLVLPSCTPSHRQRSEF